MKNLMYVVVFNNAGSGKTVHNVYEEKWEALDIFKECEDTLNFYVIKCIDSKVRENLLETTSWGKDCSKIIEQYCKVIA